MKRIGIFGGSFNPVHIAHVLLAREALEMRSTLDLDEVRFMPAAQNPLKSGAEQAPAADRLAMLELALEGEPGLRIDARELERPGPSYTVESLRAIAAEEPDHTRLYLIFGQDQLTALHRWREFEAILDLATPIIFPRGPLTPDGPPLPTTHPLLAGREIHWLTRRMDISSTEIRNRVASGLEIRYLVPDRAADYIQAQSLYNSL